MPTDKPRVLVVGSSSAEIESLVPFARSIAGDSPTGLVLLGLVAVPARASLSTGALETRRLREALERRTRRFDARVIARVGHDIWREAEKTVEDEGCALMLLHASNLPPQEWLRRQRCDLALAKPPFPSRGCRILLPIRGGRYAALALRLALAIAETQRGEITVLHAVAPVQKRDEAYGALLARLHALRQVTRWQNVRGSALRAILRASRSHDLVVMGTITVPRPGDPALGPTAAAILKKADTPVLVVRSAPERTTLPAPEAAAEPVDFTISVIVDKWFAENTFDAREFRDLKQLVRLKEKQGLTISLGLPALNEEKTIGKIVEMVRTRFMERDPLIDEIVVIDSNSTDRTVEIATRLGVPVVKHPEVLRQYDTWVGKGEALWNSLYVLRGDLIAWIDTDIVNIHPRFVYGILGPLIREPRLKYVKGFYQRPLRVGKQLQARGGGRVTELVARPLLNLFYPELSGLVQPLAGEYAGRRDALESVPFFAGYGVEIGLLIDLLSRYGLSAIGQVDLEERVHRNQSLLALSKMAFEIIQVVMLRVGSAHETELVNELNKSMKMIRYDRAEFQLEVADIRARERPPMIQIPEYRRERGLPV
ncbi:MAG: glucosyl-3-phosphoglycerate synthase [Chloroflexi bacterium]|nr:glucosyl-3-phosphoglycerate synthase [Chloroflexota bacterium]